MTLQKPKPPLTALRNFSLDYGRNQENVIHLLVLHHKTRTMNLPRSTPSTEVGAFGQNLVSVATENHQPSTPMTKMSIDAQRTEHALRTSYLDL